LTISTFRKEGPVRDAPVYANRQTDRGQTDGHRGETDGQTEERQVDNQSRDRHRTEGKTDRGETYGQTNLTKLISAFRDYVKPSKK
jgi:hypothetical protein